MARLQTVQTINRPFTTNVDTGGARANIHINDSGYDDEKQHFFNIRKSFSKGLGDAVGFATEIVSASAKIGMKEANKEKQIAQKEKLAKNKVDASSYMDGLRRETGKFQEANKAQTNTKLMQGDYENQMQAYTDDYRKTNNVSDEVWEMVKAPTASYIANSQVRNNHTASTNFSKVQMNRLQNNRQEALTNATVTSYEQDFANHKARQNAMQEYVPVDVVSDDETFTRQHKVTSYGKLISTSPNMQKSTYENDKALWDDDKAILSKTLAKKNEQTRSSLIDGMYGKISNGTFNETDIEQAKQFKDMNGNQLLSNKTILNSEKMLATMQKKEIAVASQETKNEADALINAEYFSTPENTGDVDFASNNRYKELMELPNVTMEQVKKFKKVQADKIKTAETVSDMDDTSKRNRKYLIKDIGAKFGLNVKKGEPINPNAEFGVYDEGKQGWFWNDAPLANRKKIMYAISDELRGMDEWYAKNKGWTLEEAETELDTRLSKYAKELYTKEVLYRGNTNKQRVQNPKNNKWYVLEADGQYHLER